ncbi:cytochrome P450 [Cellulosimicrobium marinum]|uniref:cytochrome P450 n=1 Tax=Cellulosimicrobium marinum TaxID=1638992 RepID=UPI001E509FD3|nr:cytochrome P450 [Cellulosimicrobium marinum]MCB7137866.1 cytochrome P450 [Cellulosimicrobium marinum]
MTTVPTAPGADRAAARAAARRWRPAVATTRHEVALLAAARPAMAGLLLAGGALAGPRAGGGLRRVPGIGWVTADPTVGRRVLTDHQHFTIVGEGGVGHLWAQILGDWVLDLFDGPGHHDLRTRSRELFTEASAAALVDGAWSGALGDARATLATGGTVDVGLLARVLVGRMMISLLGVPAPGGVSPGTRTPDDDALAAFATGERLASIALGSAGSTSLSPEQVVAAREIVDELTRGVPDGWRHAPADRLLGRCRELGLGLEETTGLASLLMVAGTETSASAMARTTALLVDTGEQHRLLHLLAEERDRPVERAPGEPDAVENAVREGLRVTSPASVVGRGVSADVEVAGRTLRAGERIMVLTWSANTAVGPFLADRPYVRETRQLWFGAGRHLCLGAALARAEIAALLHALWDDGAPLRVVSRRAKRRVLVPGYETLVVARA